MSTQPLPYQYGVEARALESLCEIFAQAGAAMKKYLGCADFARRTTEMLNMDLRPITAKWHRAHLEGRLNSRDAPPNHKFKVCTTGQKRRLTPQIKREFKRRAAIEPVIGHLKEQHRMGRNHLAHASGDAINAVLAAVGYNFRRLLAWLGLFLIALGLAAQLKLP